MASAKHSTRAKRDDLLKCFSMEKSGGGGGRGGGGGVCGLENFGTSS